MFTTCLNQNSQMIYHVSCTGSTGTPPCALIGCSIGQGIFGKSDIIAVGSGHFWEKRYHSSGFEKTDYKRALNTLRYIHANPKAARMRQGFFYDFSNYGIHERLSDDGLTQWHPAFLSLGKSLDECVRKYKGFCKKYKPKPKPDKRCHWGNKLLPKVLKAREKKKQAPGQMRLPWDEWEANNDEIRLVAEKFVMANCYDPKVAAQFFNDS